MKVHHVLCLLALLQGVAGDGKEGKHHNNDDNRRGLKAPNECFEDCQQQGQDIRVSCFEYCDIENPNDGTNDDWKENRRECKILCREIYRTKYNVCKAHCREGFLTEAEEELCADCPCCADGGTFLSSLRDPDLCVRLIDGGINFYEEDITMYRCEYDETDASAPQYFTVATMATLSERDNPFLEWKACQDNQNVNVLQDNCFHPTECDDTEVTPTSPEWDACVSLFDSIQGRKFPAGCQFGDFLKGFDIDGYCKNVLAS